MRIRNMMLGLAAVGMAVPPVAANAASSLSLSRALPSMAGASAFQDDDDDDGGSTAIILGVVLVVLIAAVAISGGGGSSSP